MKREGPCCHCGITYTPLWRSGPREKPVLCNACGSRWRIRGTLVDYIPKHATKDNQGKRPKYGAEVTEPDLSSVCFEDDTTNRSSLGSTASSETCIHTENINGSEDFKIWDRESIPRRKRSVLNQWVLSPVARLHKDLLHITCQQELLNESEDEDVLIYENINIYSSPPETALGAMLLQSPNPATNKNKPESPFTEGEKNPESPIPEKENNPESSLSGKENKPESPLLEKENNPESPLPENENNPESPLPENKTSCSTDVSLGQLTSKSIPLSNQVDQKNKFSPYMCTRGRSRGKKHSADHTCTRSRDFCEECCNGWKDVYIHPFPSAEVEAVFLTARNEGHKLQYNRTLEEERRQHNSGYGGCIEDEAELFDIPLFAALDLGSDIVPSTLSFTRE